ncbi:MAG TPA: hypothetical protein VHB68_10965 [Steroidobacteraceae bacterium]|nr:hypothetical protein [Steroidobacteraceae bacterium]
MATPPSKPASPSQPPQASSRPERSAGAIVRREALILVLALALGFIGMPLLIWVVGNRVLGTYTHAQDPTAGTGPARLLADYFQGLTHGSLAFWCVAIGPYVLIWLARLLYGVARPSPARL